MQPSRITAAVAVVSLFVPLWLLAGADAPQAPAPPPGQGSSDPFKLVGPGSCSARACHGGIEPVQPAGGQTIGQNEYSLWMARHDKHTEAYRVLLDEKSKLIQGHLDHKNSKETHPEKNVLCLSCHVQQPYPKDFGAELNEEDLKIFGVGCENCHGAAKEWLKPHTSPDWRNRSDREKAKLGMTSTKDLAVRAGVCVKCHVGTKDGDMNHDLIAAGHPRLNFEFAAFMANMPRHWSIQNPIEAARKKPSFEVHSWAVGQAATAKAALELLAYRADPNIAPLKGATKPWPEFAEYDCFSCHHNLLGESWRQKRGFENPKRKPGAFLWSDWYVTMPLSLASDDATLKLTLPNDLTEIARSMSQPYDRRKIADLARKAAKELGTLQTKLAGKADGQIEVTKLLKKLAQDYQNRKDASWDYAAQLYLALAAGLEKDEQKKKALEALLTALNFGDDTNVRFNSPQNDASRGKFNDILNKLVTGIK
jgi:hypothetical protein